jgi:Relaxase/Mobilisation nuclease domain
MIIKSLGRKASKRAGETGRGKSLFQKLTEYMVREDNNEKSQSVLWHGFYGQAGMDEAEIYKAFERNAEKLKQRANGNVLYHEIISFATGYRLKDEALIRAVADIGQEYLRQRAAEQMAFGAVHIDTEHIHLHLMISANAVGKSERVRLSKKEFADIQKSVETYTLSQYPELGQTPIYDREPNKHRERLKTEVHEQAMKARTREPSRKDTIKSRLHSLFEMAANRQALDDLLRTEKLSFYTRGKNNGIIETLEDGTTRKHRLQTLGLAEHYSKTVERFESLDTGKTKPHANRVNPSAPAQEINENSPVPAYTDDILKRAHDREQGRASQPQEQAQVEPSKAPPADRKSDRGDDHER